MSSYGSFINGFTLGFSLILAIGAQNAFVLKQGIKNNHIFLICIICALSDAFLIFVGVSGLGFIIKKFPVLLAITKYFGVIFLVYYGILNLYSALTKAHALEITNQDHHNIINIVMLTLGFTWLNPHVYLDTVLLLGSISAQYGHFRYFFAIGAICASFVFFFSLGYGARLFAPIFQKQISWKILEGVIGITMLIIALKIYLIPLNTI
ncbi:amino acid transporter [Deferribacteraceae bacterium V6Fe1]|nr:amino acid transporter [Deferribacteraceae bacterium V6Fe1]